MKVWGLTDTRVGSSKQTVSLSKSLDGNAVFKNVNYTKLIALPNFLRPKILGIDFMNSDNLSIKNIEEVPDIIIFAGRRLAGLALYLKKIFFKRFKKEVKIISILNPNYSFKNFFCIILPVHDGIKAKNVLTFRGALCEIDFKAIEGEKTLWDEKLSSFTSPFISLMVGGDTKHKTFDEKKLGTMVSNLSKKVKEIGGTLLVSSSRRTNEKCIDAIEKNLNCKNYFFKWHQDIKSNPYYSFLFKSSLVIITGESISMICEALTLKKSVLLYKPEESLEQKHREFCKNLIEDDLAREVDCQVKKLDIFVTQGLNELERIKNEILLKISLERI
jgi:mitochondrial fission protein ELM1